jgi:hypothetical protein
MENSMTTQQDFSEYVGHLAARIRIFSDHVKASTHETNDQRGR